MTNPVPPAQRPGSPALGAPSHTRYYVIVFAVVLAVIQYIDRVAISLVEGDIRLDLGLSQKQMGLVFGGLHPGLRALRDPDRLPRRPDRRAQGAHPRGPLVVVLHLGDGPGLELVLADDRPVPLRHGRSRLLPQHRPRLQQMAADLRTGPCPEHPLDERPLGRRDHAAVARPAVAAAVRTPRRPRPRITGDLAGRVHALWPARRLLVPRLLRLVPRSTGRPPEGERGRTRADAPAEGR